MAYSYSVIYDGQCNLCVNLVRLLETLDRGQTFHYVPMQETTILEQLGITPTSCELGMILLEGKPPHRRWQGSAAAEEIARILPMGSVFVEAYRRIPGLKQAGDRFYEDVRDNRYSWFGKRDRLYNSAYPVNDTDSEASVTSPTASDPLPAPDAST
ncbi:thiol-disulfide oxidoreductase DCC family protein [Vacuolonema iberomarrocanum]|uniref:thiol-disulfide oxidoreductase DCC family protein n=1 Tax=Vacuolonema iberomarrocanum TaxID=3454632 RepID=UPI0019FBC1E8|nr:DUF393 domain-containing protein [filamentous cyanobacterium LEGE 07170]